MYISLTENHYSTFKESLADAFCTMWVQDKPVFFKIGDIFMYVEPNMTIKEVWRSYEKKVSMKYAVLERKTNKYER